MMNSRTHRRRASVRHPEDKNGESPSLLESVVSYLTDRLARGAMLRVNHGIHEVLRWTILRLTLGWIGSVIMAGGIALLLASGVNGLEALHCPPWLAFLLTGILTVITALVAMKGILWPGKKDP
jgi:hypothetical protein